MPGAPSELSFRILRAGAGAGKTTTLVTTFLDFCEARLRSGEKPSVVITTFTRKATQEVRERLTRGALKRLIEARAAGDGERARIGQQVLDLLGQRSRVHISTIHGVLAVFLSRSATLAGSSPDFRILSSEELDRRRKRELYRLLQESDDFAELRAEYGFKELCRFLVDALEARELRPDLRFLSREEMKDSVFSELGDLAFQAAELAAVLDGLDSLTPAWSAWRDELKSFRAPESEEELKNFIAAVRGRSPSRKGLRSKTQPDGFYEDYEQWHERYKRFFSDRTLHLADPSYWDRHEHLNTLFGELLKRFSSRWDEIVTTEGILGMSDLETLSLRRLRAKPELGSAFSRSWDYWMIDEYQDTSPLQVELLRHLVGDRPHFIVGDPQQSIYAFRGARSEVFDAKFEEFRSSGKRADLQLDNFRSRAPLLNFINDCFQNRAGFGAMNPKEIKDAWPATEPAVEFWVVAPELDETGRARRSLGATRAVVGRIVELLEKGAAPESICVLSRSNRPLKDVLEACRRSAIPVQIHSSGGFSDRREVRDALAFLRFLLNPSDNLNLFVLLRSPWFLCDDSELARVGESARKESCWSAARKHFAGEAADHPVHRLSAWQERAAREGLARCLEALYREEGVMDRTEEIDPSGRREANLWKILSLLEKEQRRPGFNGLLFVENLGQQMSTEDSVDDSDAVPAVEPKRVNLMTVHASKGLQFDHVLIPYIDRAAQSERSTPWSFDEARALWSLAPKNEDEGFLYSSLASQLRDERKARSQAESLRVLYVAMTRARQTLGFFWEDGASKKDSWVSEFEGFLAEDGESANERYRWHVRREPAVERSWTSGFAGAGIAPGLWRPPARSERKVQSPTLLLEKSQQGREAESAPRPAVDAIQALKIAQQGTDAHRLFEALKFADVERVRHMTEEPLMHGALDYIVELKNPPLLEIIRSGEVEWGFRVKGDSFDLQGQIDLWGKVDGVVWIVDYKTGSMRHMKKALDQMKIYAWALHKMGFWKDGERLGLAAVYPMDRETRPETFASAKDLRSAWIEWGLISG